MMHSRSHQFFKVSVRFEPHTKELIVHILEFTPVSLPKKCATKKPQGRIQIKDALDITSPRLSLHVNCTHGHRVPFPIWRNLLRDRKYLSLGNDRVVNKYHPVPGLVEVAKHLNYRLTDDRQSRGTEGTVSAIIEGRSLRVELQMEPQSQTPVQERPVAYQGVCEFWMTLTDGGNCALDDARVRTVTLKAPELISAWRMGAPRSPDAFTFQNYQCGTQL